LCLGVPALVKAVRGDVALVDFGDGVEREVLGATYEDVKPGDIVIVHAGVIIEKLKDEKLDELLRMLNEFREDLEKKADELLRSLSYPSEPTYGG